jgi:hypothetical protein
MKQNHPPSNRAPLARWGRFSFALCWLGLALSALGQTIPNPSFEADTFTVFPGYINANAAITGWTASQNDRAGLNPAGGSPFADNGAIPAGLNVAFIQSAAGGPTLSTTISDLTVDTTYKVTFRANARGGQTANLRISIDGTELLAMAVSSVGGSAPYKYVAFEFTATAASQTLSLLNDAAGDNTLLVDDFAISAATGGWSYAAWNDDATSGVDSANTYTHAYNFGGEVALDTTINGVLFKGLVGGNPVVANEFFIAGLGNAFAPDDANNITTGGSAELAKRFIYGGNPGYFSIANLVPGMEYVATFYAVAWESGLRSQTFAYGNDRLTVNQDQFGDNNGIRISYRYIAPPEGALTLTQTPTLAANSLHLYGFANYEANPQPMPVVGVQPRSQVSTPGSTATFSITAAGAQPLTFQWYRGDLELLDQTSRFLTLSNLTIDDLGDYTVVVANGNGSATSQVATLSFGLIANPSFEADVFWTWPGYASGNHPISGWTASDLGRVGVNPMLGYPGPFADNGAVPDGTQVGFIQSAGPVSLSTILDGLEAGTTYKVTLRANARNGQGPNLRISIDGTEVLGLTVYSVGGTAPYGYLAFEFTAAAASQTMTLLNDAAGDNTVLIDDVKIAPSSGAWSVAPWTNDSDSGVDPNFVYTHAYSFANGANFTINSVPFTGVTGVNPAIPGQFSTVLLGIAFNGDANTMTAAGGGSATLASDFLYGGTIAAGNYQSITLQGLTPGTEYVATVYSVGWEAPNLASRWATVSAGEDRLTINQDKYGDNNGILLIYRYTADETGTVTLRAAPVNPANVSIHTYGFSNREAVSRNVKPVIVTQPRSTTVAEGQPVLFSVVASGIPTPTYQWRYNGGEIFGANAASYSLPEAFSGDEGEYDVVVANVAGSVTSVVARLKTGLPMTNPSFEIDNFTVFPGYVSGNGPITAWTALGGHGLNPANGSPFADNGVIPHGSHVAFMQADGPLSQLMSGFTPDAQYYLHYYENARSGGTLPSIEVTLGGTTLVAPHAVTQVGGSNPYHEIFGDVFVATATEAELAFIKSNPQGGDTTALIDNVCFVEVLAGTAPFIGRDPQSLAAPVGQSAAFSAQGIGSLPLSYQWLKDGVEITGATAQTLTLVNVQTTDAAGYAAVIRNDFGMVTSLVARLTVDEPITDLFNTGVGNNRFTLADGAVDPHYQLIVNPDTGSANAIVENSQAFPISTATWLPYSTISGWIGPRVDTAASAVGLYTYRTVIDLTGRDPSTVVIAGHWSTDNAGRDIRVNGVSTGNPENGGFNVYTPFTIYGTNANFVAGPNALEFIVENVGAIGYTGLRVEFLQSNVRIPAGVVPEITTQPVSQQAAIGDTVTFTGAGWGTGPLSYQWIKDGAPLPGQTGLSLVLSSVTAGDSGFYTLSVSNSAGTTLSAPASLCVWLQPIPGVFGTGLDDTGALLAEGAIDPHYQLTVSSDGNYPGPEAYVVSNGYPIQAGAWLLNGPNSKWIAPWANQNDSAGGGGGNAGGSYTYQTSFDLTGYDPSKIMLVGGWAVDNAGNDILVNGFSTGITSPGFGGLTSFTITSAQGLLAGANTIDFVVTNGVNATVTPNPFGLRVDLKAYLNILDLQPLLTIARNGESVSVSWAPAGPCLKLQGAPAVTGPWNDIVNAPNPYTTGTTNAMQFFRLVAP